MMCCACWKSVLGFSSCVVAMLLLSGCDTPVAAPTSYDSYNATDGTFQFEYPAEWDADGGGKGFQWATISKGGAKIEVETGVLGSMMGEAINAQIQATGNPVVSDDRTPVAQVHEAQEKAFAKDHTDYAELNTNTVKSAGLGDVRVSEFTQSGNFGAKIHGYRVTALGNDKMVQVVCTCSESNWATLQPAFDHVIASLKRGKVER